MEISISIEQAIEPVAVTRSKGKIDVSNFLDVVTKVLYHLKKQGKEENAITYGYGFDTLHLRTMPSGGSTAKINIVISSAIRFAVSTAHPGPPTKERLAVLGVPRNGRKRTFRLNAQALGYLKNLKLPRVNLPILQK